MSNIKENSLTAPEDRTSTRENPWRPDVGDALTTEEVKTAMEDLNVNNLEKYPRLDRSYIDPPPTNQNFGLISFTPAKGSTPNDKGVYGYAKLRGNYTTNIEANERAKYLIKNVDSYHQIFHTYVGRPFPLTVSSDYSAEVDEVDIRKDIAESVSDEIKTKKAAEKRAMNDIKDREEELLTESRKAVNDEEIYDTYDNYITLKVKKAQLSWTYLEHVKKMEEIVPILAKTRKELEDLDAAHPDYKEKYFEKYMDARKNAGLEHSKGVEDNFVKYMVEDATLPAVDEYYEKNFATCSIEEGAGEEKKKD